MSNPDDFCQWCYDRGLRYSRPGPWSHAIECPSNPIQKSPNSLPLVIAALKEAYANAHQCDLRDRCPGCMAGYAIEAITGRKWTQEECESSQSELAQLREERDAARATAMGNDELAAMIRDEAEKLDEENEKLNAERASALADNVALRDALENLYTHPPTCSVHDPFLDEDYRPCSCGRGKVRETVLATPSPGHPILDAIEKAAVASSEMLESLKMLGTFYRHREPWTTCQVGKVITEAEQALAALDRYRRKA